MVQDDIFLAARSPNPLDETVKRVTGAITARLLSPGDRLPAERELAIQLGVSRSTLRVALQMLTAKGWLEVRRGRHGGSFVTRWPRMPHPRKLSEVLSRHSEDLPALLD
ncbi:MAG: winged helix-turn-helix transcriptional regulator, partial [Roseiflexaceae bacterium]|nr:winged helix-turn-helix transcriptional regulator [Roseiflexaceae bacterium]